MSTADYKVFVDWYKDGGLSLADFEGSTSEWVGSGTTPPILTPGDTTHVYTGDFALKVAWVAYNPFQFNTAGRGFDQGRFGTYAFSNATDSFMFDAAGRGFSQGRFGYAELEDPTVDFPDVRRTFSNFFIVGKSYTSTIWTYVPSGSKAVKLGVVGVGSQTPGTPLYDQWTQLSYTWTATSTTHTVQVIPVSAPASTDLLWLDQARIYSPYADVTGRTLARTALSWKVGRDQARSLSAIAGGSMGLELDNRSRDYSPDNPASPLYGYLGPGKPAVVTATFGGTEYPLFRGVLDDYDIMPERAERSVKLTVLDLLGGLAQAKIFTDLYPSLQTGEAINKVLDAVGWPADARDIDQGATTCRWWCEDDTTALEAINRLVESEGPPGFCYIDGLGKVVFRSRHHRITEARSLSAQQTFSEGAAGDPEPGFSPPMSYNVGWRDLINDITVSVEDRRPEMLFSDAYTSQDTITLAPNEARDIQVRAQNPFLYAKTPVAGTDYTLLSGSMTVSLSRTSGQSTIIRVTAGGGGVTFEGLRMRAVMVSSATTYQVHGQDVDSIQRYGLKTSDTETSLPWASLNDVKAIVEVILGLRSERLPIVSIVVNNENNTRLGAVLGRQLSDRIHIKESETFTDHDFYIEQISHNIEQAGMLHTAEFGCERVREQVSNVFTFNDAARGFDKGLFGRTGIDMASNIFRLDVSKLDEGLLGH